MTLEDMKKKTWNLLTDNKLWRYIAYQPSDQGCLHTLRDVKNAFVAPKRRFKICKPGSFGGSWWNKAWILQADNAGCFWKDKFESPRFEGTPYGIFGPSPRISVTLFRLVKFIIWWEAPCDYRDEDTYWEMWLWYKYYCGSDIDKARETWPWTDGDHKSTWIEELVLPKKQHTL